MGSSVSRPRSTVFSATSNPSSPPVPLLQQQQLRRKMSLGYRNPSVELSSSSCAATLIMDNNKPPWMAPVPERRACARAWSVHFQPLLREISHVLTCVPGELPNEQLGGWDQRTYCKTLAGLVAYFEHHACWATLSALLFHSGQYGVALCYKGQRVEDTASASLQALLQGARHEDVTVQYFPVKQEHSQLRWGSFQQQERPDERFDADDEPCPLVSDGKDADEGEDLFKSICENHRLSSSSSSSFNGLHQPFANEDKDVLASEFQGWKQQWLAFRYASDARAAVSPKAASSSSELSSRDASQNVDEGRDPRASTLLVRPFCATHASSSAGASCTSDIRRDVLMVFIACIAIVVFSLFL